MQAYGSIIREALRGAGLVLLLGAVPALAGEAPAAEREAHRHEIEAWHKDRVDRLRRPDSWLTLAGLSWLAEGRSSCGSDEASAVALPPSVPARTGTFHLAAGKVEFEAAPGAEVTSLGKPVSRLVLQDDSGGTPTLLEIGSVTFYAIRRGERFGVRVKDSENPVRTGFPGIETYPVSWKWRLEARFEPYDPPKPIPVPTAIGTIDDESSPGAVVFRLAGSTYRIDALPGADETELFLVFGDTTNGPETYGGGRFLYANLEEDTGELVVDFNKSYNPPCAFTPYATCPLPPQQNRLDVPVRAGERKYGEGHH